MASNPSMNIINSQCRPHTPPPLSMSSTTIATSRFKEEKRALRTNTRICSSDEPTCTCQLENFETSLSTWMMISSIRGRIAGWGWSIHVTNWRNASGYGGLGPAGHLIWAFIMANCRLPPDSPSAYSKGDAPYLRRYWVISTNTVLEYESSLLVIITICLCLFSSL